MTTTTNKGYISLHRQIQDNWIWLCEPFSKAQAWIDLLMLASHNGSSFFIRGNRVDLKIGEIGWSKENLGLRWKWSEKKVLNFLNILEKEGQITKQKTPYLVVIKINNYEEYQKKDGQTTEQKTDRKRTENGQKTAKNNDNKENNENNDIYLPLSEGLIFVLENKMNKKLPQSKKSSWASDIKKLIEIDLKERESPFDDVQKAIQAISDNYGKEYFPVIQSAGTLREKFSKIEGYLQRSKHKSNLAWLNN